MPGRIVALLLWFLSAPALAQGRFVEFTASSTQPLIAPAHVTVWLPPGYDTGRARYGVVYMLDGQNVFFPARSSFNKVWAADKAVAGLVAAHRIAPVIVVAIDNAGPARYRDYFPDRLFALADPATQAALAQQAHGPLAGDAFLAFLADDLKPRIDRDYRTRADPAHTAIIGSSSGGLLACYAFVERPRVFGRAACVSTHWLLAMPADLPAGADVLGLWKTYLAAQLGRPGGRRLWMDHGTLTLDANYGPWQDAIDADLTALGWRKERDFESRTYPGAAHEENAWAARLPDMLAWLFR